MFNRTYYKLLNIALRNVKSFFYFLYKGFEQKIHFNDVIKKTHQDLERSFLLIPYFPLRT